MTYLRSSYITETHLFKIALYENEPFINDVITHKIINLTPLYKSLTESIDKFTRKTKSQFIRVLPYELEEIRRFYMDSLYQNSRFFFKRIVSSSTRTRKKRIKMGVFCWRWTSFCWRTGVCRLRM